MGSSSPTDEEILLAGDLVRAELALSLVRSITQRSVSLDMEKAIALKSKVESGLTEILANMRSMQHMLVRDRL